MKLTLTEFLSLPLGPLHRWCDEPIGAAHSAGQDAQP
jgi:hypothetical protein